MHTQRTKQAMQNLSHKEASLEESIDSNGARKAN